MNSLLKLQIIGGGNLKSMMCLGKGDNPMTWHEDITTTLQQREYFIDNIENIV